MSWPDVVRSLLFGQTVWTVLWAIFALALLSRYGLRPAILIGLWLISVGELTSLFYVLLNTVERLGEPASWRTLLAVFAVITESLGCIFVVLHLIFHDPKLMERIIHWFSSHEPYKGNNANKKNNNRK